MFMDKFKFRHIVRGEAPCNTSANESGFIRLYSRNIEVSRAWYNSSWGPQSEAKMLGHPAAL